MSSDLSDAGLTLRACIVLSVVFHLVFFAVTTVMGGLDAPAKIDPRPVVEVVMDQEPPEIETTPPDDAEAAPEEARQPEEIAPEPPAEETTAEESAETGDEGGAVGGPADAADAAQEQATVAEDSPGGDVEPPPDATGDASVPPPAMAESLPPPAEAGGTADQGSQVPPGTEMEPPAGEPGGPADTAPTGDLPEGGSDALESDMTTATAELGEDVTVPAIGEDVTVLPGGPAGLAPSGDPGAYDWSGYIIRLQRYLGEVITPRLPSSIDPRAKNPIVQVTVMRDGTVRARRVHQSSGIAEIDAVVLEALERKMPPLPADWAKDSAAIPLEFQLPRRGR